MPDYTVITRLDRDGMHDYYAAIPGRVDVHGEDVHTAHVAASDPTAALNTVADAYRTVGPANVRPNSSDPVWGTRWTVLGISDRYEPGYPTLFAAVAGEHTVHGYRDSMRSPRWTTVVDASSAEAAFEAAMEVARREYKTATARD